MPSFYAANPHGQVPLQQPDYAMRYGKAVYGQDPVVYPTYQPSVANELGTLLPDPYDMYKSAAVRSSMYHQSHQYTNGPANTQRHVGAPMIPPVRVDDRYVGDRGDKRQASHRGYMAQNYNAKDDKAVGGVSAKLDYDMERMTDFVTEMTIGMYELYMSQICISDIDVVRSIQPGINVPGTFRKWVLQVLNATRLPSATILLGLSYLSQRTRGLQATGRFVPSERSLYQMLTVALILGSKFLDDNTFQNKSWAEVSNISVAELNHDEREWLTAFGHRLHHDPRSTDGYKSWEEQWNRYNSQTNISSTALHPIDTNIHRQRQPRQHLSAAEYQAYSKSAVPSFVIESEVAESHYRTPTYSPYDPWFNQRSAVDRSPSSAPHTGPTTPEYYQTLGAWGPADPYNARHMPYSYPTVPQFVPQLPQQQSSYPPPPLHYAQPTQTAWNCHGATCQCHSCRQAQSFQPRYGPIVVG